MFYIANKTQAPEVSVNNISCIYKKTGQRLNLFYDKQENKGYIFVPQYVALNDLFFYDETNELIFELNGREIKNESLSIVSFSKEYVFEIKDKNKTILKCPIIFQKLGNIQTMCVNTRSANMNYIHENKEHAEDISIEIYDTYGGLTFMETGEISGRGNTSWGENAKRPYNISFKNKTSILGFNPVKTYAVMANYSDESRLRNYLVYNTAKKLGIEYSSQMKNIDLFINGDYYGIYSLCTKNEYMTDAEERNINGMFEIADAYKYEFLSDSETPIIGYYGNKDFLLSVINNFENKLYSKDSFDNLSKLIDMKSFAKKYLLEEFFLNFDYYKSQYFYIDKNNIIHTANAWDYDLTIGKYFGKYNKNADKDLMFKKYRDFWITYLYGYPEFRQLMVEVFNSCFTDDFIKSISYMLQEEIQNAENSLYADFLKYKNQLPFGDGTIQSELIGVDENTAFLQEFLKNRFEFLSKYYNETFVDDVSLPESITPLSIPKSQPLYKEMMNYKRDTAVIIMFVLFFGIAVLIYVRSIRDKRRRR